MENSKQLNSKLRQIHTISMRCPKGNECIDSLYSALVIGLPRYRFEGVGEMSIRNVPVIDFYNIIQPTINYCVASGINCTYLEYIMGVIHSFMNLKYITLEFTDDDFVSTTYASVESSGNKELLLSVYHIDMIELILSDSVGQNVMDILNKSLIFDGILSNEYLKRRFVIDFTFDNYTSFTDMIVNNNFHYFDSPEGKPALDALKMFPKIMGEHKPMVRVVTNYALL